MPFLAHKKKRTTRTIPLRSKSPLRDWLARTVGNRSLLGRLLLGLLTVVALLFAVQGWKPTFPYRRGDRADEAVTARIDFQVFNRLETERKRLQAAELVPNVFRHDPNLMADLPARLRSHLNEMRNAESVEKLPVEVRSAFGLPAAVPPAGENKAAPTAEERFAEFKGMLEAASEETGTVLEQMLNEFQILLENRLNRYGRVAPEEFTRNNLSFDRRIRIVSTGEADVQPPSPLLPSDVLLEEALKETGALGRTWSQYPQLRKIRRFLEQWLLSQVPVTLRFDNEATQAARAEARQRSENNVFDFYEKNAVLVASGEMIDDKVLELLQAEYNAVQSTTQPIDTILRTGVAFLLLLLLVVFNGFYLVRNEPRLVNNAGRLALYLGLAVAAVALGRLLWFDSWRAEIIPLLSAVMIVAIVYNQRLASITALTLSLLLTISTGNDLIQFIILMSVSLAAVIPLSQVASRSVLIKVGFLCGLLYFLVSWSAETIHNPSADATWLDSGRLISSLRGAGWCLVAGYLVAGSLPFLEPVFGMVTDMSLLELSDVSHPLLQELVRRAPGTYNHSIAVATIGETAADLIGANGLLVRVGAYFHDVGKMLKPQYFVENMTEGSESLHAHLAPAMSTLIIIGHVKDGVDLARQHNLPEALISFIEQHHGTTLVEYFYREAARQAGRQPDHKTDAQESSFRYPGPKPQSREAGVMMLADAVESASRTLSDPTPKRIESLVKDITMKRLLDDQFDESSLTLRDIRIVEESLIKSLIGIYHGRVKYPEQRTA